jgi:hypothetical protein
MALCSPSYTGAELFIIFLLLLLLLLLVIPWDHKTHQIPENLLALPTEDKSFLCYFSMVKRLQSDQRGGHISTQF